MLLKSLLYNVYSGTKWKSMLGAVWSGWWKNQAPCFWKQIKDQDRKGLA